MEAVFLVLVGAVLFSQAWHMLGLYSDGRSVGVIIGGLSLLSLGAVLLEPLLLTGSGDRTISAANHLSELTVTKTLIIVWAVYGIAVAAQALWDQDERAVGFYSAVVAAVTVFSFFYYAGNLGSSIRRPDLAQLLRGDAAAVRGVGHGLFRAGVHLQGPTAGGGMVPAGGRRDRYVYRAG